MVLSKSSIYEKESAPPKSKDSKSRKASVTTQRLAGSMLPLEETVSYEATTEKLWLCRRRWSLVRTPTTFVTTNKPAMFGLATGMESQSLIRSVKKLDQLRWVAIPNHFSSRRKGIKST